MRPPEDGCGGEWRGPDLNRRHHGFQPCALPTELPRPGGQSNANAVARYRTRVRALGLIAIVLLAVSACGSGSGSDSESEPQQPGTTAGGEAEGGTSLKITFWPAGQGGGGTQTATLSCNPTGGTHPRPEEACAKLATMDDPFAPPPTDEMCTQQYGGDEQALIEGIYEGQPVHYPLSRTNGCEIARFEQFRFLLPGSGRA